MEKEITKIAAALRTIADSLERLAASQTAKPVKSLKRLGKAGGRTKTPESETDSNPNSQAPRILNRVFEAIKARRKKTGVDAKEIMKKTGLDSRQVSNSLYKLTRAGKVTRVDRGLYIAVPQPKTDKG